MLKGVNRRVIEVKRPDSAYFERAVFYLRPEVDDIPAYAALHETEGCFNGVKVTRSIRLRRWLWFLLGTLVSGGGFLLFYLLSRLS